MVFDPYRYSQYYWKANVGFTGIKALVLDILLLAAIFYTGALLIRRSGKQALIETARWGMFLVLILPINSFFRQPNTASLDVLFAKKWLASLFMLLTLGVLLVLHRYRRQAVRIVAVILIILSPLFVVNFSHALWLHLRHVPVVEPLADKKSERNESITRADSPRALWIVFDELDQRTAFVDRPPSVDLPEFDRLRSQALYSLNAFPPGGETMISMPALTTGQLIANAVPASLNELNLTLADKSVVGWSKLPNVFSQAQSEGFKTALVGWYHPYCRIIGNSLDSCMWEPLVTEASPTLERMNLKQSMALWARTAFHRIPFAFRLFSKEANALTEQKRHHAEEYMRLVSGAQRSILSDANLILLHFPIPHTPGIYDRATGSVSLAPQTQYVDNLVLADRTLGELRRTLETAGIWDSSTVLITSDHWNRESTAVNGRRDHRIPFILKIAGQKTGVEYATPFNTILTRDLLMELLRGKLRAPEKVIEWLDQRSALAESPFTRDLP